MANYILSIFKYYLPIVWSWGMCNAVAIENGLRFTVNGYLHQGKVEVLYDEGCDLFRVRLLNPDGSVKTEQDGIYIDGLVDTIDSLVERCVNYKQRVEQDYKFI